MAFAETHQAANCITNAMKEDGYSPAPSQDLLRGKLSGDAVCRCWWKLAAGLTVCGLWKCSFWLLRSRWCSLAFPSAVVCVVRDFPHRTRRIFLIVCGRSRCLLFLCPFYQIAAKRCWESIFLFCSRKYFFLHFFLHRLYHFLSQLLSFFVVFWVFRVYDFNFEFLVRLTRHNSGGLSFPFLFFGVC